MKRGPDPRWMIALLVLALLVGGGVTYMVYSLHSRVKEDLEALKAKALDRQELEAQQLATEQQVREMQLKLANLEQGIPELAYMPTFLREIEDVGRQGGLAVTGVRPVPQQTSASTSETDAAAAPSYQVIDFEIDGRARYRSVMTFLASLNRFPKIVEVRTISLSPANVSGRSSDMLELKAALRAYAFPPGQTALSATSPMPGQDGTQAQPSFDRRSAADMSKVEGAPANSATPPPAGGSTP